MSPTLVHLSDLHLGFRAFPAEERGGNLRERDVAGAFHAAVQELARFRPDLVLLTGDLFHTPAPPSTAFLAMTRGLHTLQSLVPGVSVLAIAGERDTPVSAADPGPVAVLDALPGVEAAAGAPRAVRFRKWSTHVLLAPYRAVCSSPLPELRPDPEARFNILLLRGGVAGPAAPSVEDDPVIGLDPSRWSYVALGGSHRPRIHRSNVRTSGSLERIGWDPWTEATEEKGFIVFDLETGEGEFHAIPTRPLVDLAPIRTSPGAPGEGTRRLRHLVEAIPGGVQGKLVRVRLEGELTHPEEGVEVGFMEGLRRHAAHLEVRLTPSHPYPREDAAARDTELRILSRGLEGVGPGVHVVHDPRPPELNHLVGFLVQEASGLPASDADASLLTLLVAGGDPQTILTKALSPEDPSGSSTEAADPASGSRRAEQAATPQATSLRGTVEDAVEAEGEVEARKLAWARDRQEAETRLQAHRDRARELKRKGGELEDEAAACPTCGKPLGDEREELLSSLREEWEMVVQDGRWWKRRREQLEERPEDLRELERTALRLRARVSELHEVPAGRRRTTEDGPIGDEDAAPHAISRPSDVSGTGSPADAAVLRRAGSCLLRWTEGRLSGIAVGRDGRLRVVERGAERPPLPAEEGDLRLTLQLSLWKEHWIRGGVVPDVMVLQGLDARGVDPLLPLLEDLPLDRVCVLVAVPRDAPLPADPRILSFLQIRSGTRDGPPVLRRLPRITPRLQFQDSQ